MLWWTIEESEGRIFLARDEYPITIASMYELMVKYSTKNNNNSIINPDDRRRGGILLTQLGKDNRGKVVPGSDGIIISEKNVLNVINLVILHGTVL